MKFVKTTITLVVMHTDDAVYVQNMPLEELAQFIDTGAGIGYITDSESVQVQPSKVREELLELGNDGSFFDAELEDLEDERPFDAKQYDINMSRLPELCCAVPPDNPLMVVLLKAGEKAYWPHNGPWPSEAEAQAYVKLANTKLGVNASQCRA